MCLARGVVGGERIILLGLDVPNYMGTGGVLDACMCLSCGGVWCRWEWVGSLDQGLEGWGGVMSV